MKPDKIFYRRVALSQAIILIVVVIVAVLLTNQPACRESGACAGPTILWTLVIALPLVTAVSWYWGRWYGQKTLTVSNQLKRDYNQQVSMVDFQRQRMSTVMRHLADGVLLLNEKGEVRLINAAACGFLNTTESDAIGQLFSSVAWQHKLIDLWQKCRDSNVEIHGTVDFDRRNLFLEAIFTPIEPQEGVGYLVVLRDLTHIRRLESIRRDFISNVSHELLTPIASVRAVVETLEDGALDNREVAIKFLGRAADEVDAMTQLVNELLTLTRIESGVTEFKFERVPVSDLVLRPVERFVEQAQRKEIALVIDLDQDLPMVSADTEQVWQVLRNLLHNSIKHTPRGGQVTVSASRKKRRNEVVLSLSDTGVGIHPNDLPRIFERFYKADRSRNRQAVSGTGLGLAIAKHIVLAHDGRIWAESKLGKGSTFFFSIPVVPINQNAGLLVEPKPQSSQ
ncbi:MAG: ATP-binding protein [Chloroflexota bacterium]